MIRAVIAVVLLACATYAVALGGPATSGTPASHFSHADHARRKVAIAKCETCHPVDANGQVTAPAALAHSPCLSAGCHAAYFAAASAAAEQRDPKLYARAAAFCLGCHDSATGMPPVPWQKPTTNAGLRSFQYEREYHVEMNHFEHAVRTECRSCHVVEDPKRVAGGGEPDGSAGGAGASSPGSNDKSFAMVASAPGHAQCVHCHNAVKFPQFTMASCNFCHDKPSRAEYFKGTRPKIDVRACGGEGHAALEARLKRSVSCFRHERLEHRTLDGAPLPCATCHYMIADKAKWGGRRYQTLRDLHISTIIDNSQDRQHRSCGRGTACHQMDVDAARPGAKCSLCHAQRSSL